MSPGRIIDYWQMTMVSGRSDLSDPTVSAVSRREEFFAFLVLAIFIWPIVTVGVVGGYGFLVWMLQVVFGPPGPPH
jgi:nitrate reductase NapE